ncbi:DUF2652 domain-containing protein [Aurantibacter crassamenti]|uniref:DUF2652 domain-containing protein n=1 Tax=Aurantibacter crassamenti TaxID=1837375 RepID=UPI0019395974|nr:DUF2652 domain-containing protein [Aurantibacter crassamenti]MBM1104583.1 DUF2652 domain-containing protein [Aurantibacter crassamenti]
MKSNSKAEPTLICIPDISGFTKFMSETDFELSSKVIPSLLNQIIYSNEIGLKVSEIEGDAVLFFRTGPLPNFKELVDQCRQFYIEFYRRLEVLRKKYSENEQALLIPSMLGLKIILHYGVEVAPIKVGTRIKLIGEDLIIAHKLLKNEVPLDEYLLLSEALTDEYKKTTIDNNIDWSELIEHETQYRHIGDVNYSYIGLKGLLE